MLVSWVCQLQGSSDEVANSMLVSWVCQLQGSSDEVADDHNIIYEVCTGTNNFSDIQNHLCECAMVNCLVQKTVPPSSVSFPVTVINRTRVLQ